MVDVQEYLDIVYPLKQRKVITYLKNKNLSFQDKLQRLVNIAQGLKDIHQKNLVHRDFHSGNILNEPNQCLIADLGLCKPVNEANEVNKFYGVLPYVAPEILNKKSYTPKVDVYSFGVITHELFSDSSPFLDRDYDV